MKGRECIRAVQKKIRLRQENSEINEQSSEEKIQKVGGIRVKTKRM